MQAVFKIVVADDHPVFLAGLKQILSSDREFVVVSEAMDGDQALAAIREREPDIALLDLDLPKRSGLEVVRTLRLEKSPVKTLILTMHNTATLLNEALDAGVSGYLLKDNAAVDIMNGLRTVAGGGIYISPAMSAHLVRRTQGSAVLLAKAPGLGDLTPTERRVLKRVAVGKTSREIGRELFISHRTVETHRRNICEKLDLHGSNKLVQFAIEHRADL